MNEELPEELPQELKSGIERLAGAARPTEDPVDSVRRGLRRRRRRRAATAVGGSAVLVAAVAAAAVALPGSDGGAAPEPVAPPSSAPDLFSCPTGLEQYEDAPPIPDLDEQQKIADEVIRKTRTLSAWTVRVAQPSHLGVVALVLGSVDVARPLLQALGVRVIAEYLPYGDEPVEDDVQVSMAIQQELDSVLREVQRATRGIPGRAGFAFWQEAGAIVVQWKEPVPPEVQALAGERPGGGQVLVWPTRYSEADVRRAMGQVEDSLRTSGDDDRVSSYSGCADRSGLRVGIVPPIDDRRALQEQLTADVGMPVMVEPEERPIAFDR